MVFFSIRLKDLHSYHKNFYCKNAVFVNTHKFVILENENLNFYSVNKFLMAESLELTADKIFPGILNHILV